MPLLSATAPCAQTVTLLGNSVPNTPVDPDTSAVTLGMKLWSTQAGTHGTAHVSADALAEASSDPPAVNSLTVYPLPFLAPR
jgi:hypothetical protein